MAAFIEIKAGQRFGRLTVECTRPHGVEDVLCRCQCGSIRTFNFRHLLRGATRSCGCLRKETSARRHLQHGQGGGRVQRSPEYEAWAGMRQRCLNQKDKAYERYGARGIKICTRWMKSFQAFYSDMGPRPSSLHSIDRINNDGSYAPRNCRWATRSEQNANRSISQKYKSTRARERLIICTPDRVDRAVTL